MGVQSEKQRLDEKRDNNDKINNFKEASVEGRREHRLWEENGCIIIVVGNSEFSKYLIVKN